MQVLKKVSKSWSDERLCTGHGNGDGGCGSKLLVDLDDLFFTESHCRDEIERCLTFRCPECGQMTDLAGMFSTQPPPFLHNQIPMGVKHPDGGYCHPNDFPLGSKESE